LRTLSRFTAQRFAVLFEHSLQKSMPTARWASFFATTPQRSTECEPSVHALREIRSSLNVASDESSFVTVVRSSTPPALRSQRQQAVRCRHETRPSERGSLQRVLHRLGVRSEGRLRHEAVATTKQFQPLHRLNGQLRLTTPAAVPSCFSEKGLRSQSLVGDRRAATRLSPPGAAE